tara:strand:- start:99 stop:254 length:156 start_codon:yes stop_codon:yes gene_type:complete
MAQQATHSPAFVTRISPDQPPEVIDTNPSDKQPPGVDEKEYESLEEALLGE